MKLTYGVLRRIAISRIALHMESLWNFKMRNTKEGYKFTIYPSFKYWEIRGNIPMDAPSRVRKSAQKKLLNIKTSLVSSLTRRIFSFIHVLFRNVSQHEHIVESYGVSHNLWCCVRHVVICVNFLWAFQVSQDDEVHTTFYYNGEVNNRLIISTC